MTVFGRSDPRARPHARAAAAARSGRLHGCCSLGRPARCPWAMRRRDLLCHRLGWPPLCYTVDVVLPRRRQRRPAAVVMQVVQRSLHLVDASLHGRARCHACGAAFHLGMVRMSSDEGALHIADARSLEASTGRCTAMACVPLTASTSIIRWLCGCCLVLWQLPGPGSATDRALSLTTRSQPAVMRLPRGVARVVIS